MADLTSVSSIMVALQAKGSEQYRKTYARHGMTPARVIGVSSADMKALAKTLRGQQALALELYATGMLEAMYLAGLVADGAAMTRQELNAWADATDGLPMISENTIPWVASESRFGRDLAMEWIASPKEHVAASGWRAYSALVTTKADAELHLPEIETLLHKVAAEIAAAPNRVKAAMNSFVIAVGSYVKPLTMQAKAAAARIGTVPVDVGDTACKVPTALPYIEKAEASGKAGLKRKTVRC